jgi:AcrR family transcriptional regulator
LAEKSGIEGTDRRSQIIKSAVGLMSDRGLAGTTTARIAADVGVSEPALYRHFASKQDILLAALDDISARLLFNTITAASDETDIVSSLKKMSAAFYDYVMSNQDEIRVLIEVMNAVVEQDMRQAVRDRFAQMLAIVESLVAEGIRQGTLRKDLDPSLGAWEIVSLGVTLYFASSLGFEDMLTKEKALAAVDRLFDSMLAPEIKERRKKG